MGTVRLQALAGYSVQSTGGECERERGREKEREAGQAALVSRT